MCDDGVCGWDWCVYCVWFVCVCVMCLCVWFVLGGWREGEERGCVCGVVWWFVVVVDVRCEVLRMTVTREFRGMIDGEVEREVKNELWVVVVMECVWEDVWVEVVWVSLELEMLWDEYLGDVSAGLDVERVLESVEKAVEENWMEKVEMGVVFLLEMMMMMENENGEMWDDDDDDVIFKIGMFSGYVEVSRESAKDVVIGFLEDELCVICLVLYLELELLFVNEVVLKNVIDLMCIWMILLNASRAFVYEGFLTDEECDYIFVLLKGYLYKLGVVDVKMGGFIMSDICMLMGMFISRAYDFTIIAIEERIELWL